MTASYLRHRILVMVTVTTAFSGCKQAEKALCDGNKRTSYPVETKSVPSFAISQDACPATFSGKTVTVTINDLLAVLNDDSGRHVHPEPTPPSELPVGKPADPKKHQTRLDLHFPKDWVTGGQSPIYSKLVIELNNDHPAHSLTLAFIPGASDNDPSYALTSGKEKQFSSFCGLGQIQPGNNPSITVGVKAVPNIYEDTLNIGLLVSDGKYTTPVVLDPKVGNDG